MGLGAIPAGYRLYARDRILFHRSGGYSLSSEGNESWVLRLRNVSGGSHRRRTSIDRAILQDDRLFRLLPGWAVNVAQQFRHRVPRRDNSP